MSKVSRDLSSVTVVGLDLAKRVFQVCCVDRDGRTIINRSLQRREVLLFFSGFIPAWSESKPVARRTIGRGHSWKPGMM